MRKLFLTISISVVAIVSSFGQKNWEDKFNGLIITQGDSTIKGYLSFSVGSKDRGTKITLLKTPRGKPRIFSTLELKGFAYKRDTFKIIHDLQPYLDDNKIIEKAEASFNLQN